MVSAGEFRNGLTFDIDGNVFQIIEFQHVKPGKGAAFVRTKIKNVITGAVVERTFSPTEKFPTAYVERKDMQYLYSDGDLYYFMDLENYEQLPINKSLLSDGFRFVKENMEVKVLSYKGNVFGVEPPNFVELQVTQTDPGFQGRHGNQRNQACCFGNRRRNQSPALYRGGGNRPHRYENRRIYGARIINYGQ